MSKITNISAEQLLQIDSITSRVIKKTFGREEDIIDLHIYDINNNLLYSEKNFKEYTLDEPKESSPSTTTNSSTKEPEIVNSEAKGAGERLYEQPGPNGSLEGYWFNTGYEMVWVSTAEESPAIGAKPELPSTIKMDPIKVLNDRAYIAGKYKLKLNIQRKKVFNSDNNPFSIKKLELLLL